MFVSVELGRTTNYFLHLFYLACVSKDAIN